MYRRILTSAAPPHEPEVVEFGDLILHDGSAVPQLGAVVLVVAGADSDDRAVDDVVQSDDFEGGRQTFVGAPVLRQRRTEDAG